MRTLGDIQPGQTLGRYEFLVPIAQGGMAAVWAARLKGTRGFSKTVAVKTMLPAVSDDPQFEQMFLDEAQIAARIIHPNVVQIHDLGEQDDILYLVMEWVDGEPLSSVRRAAAKKDGIPRRIAVKIVADACAGLHAAHELTDENGEKLGLVHRDISPQNILITYQGMVKIVDFGVAKAAGRTSQNTSAGQVKGKPPYMSPEQALGDAIDRRTDVFALGIILYQLTTGKHPFRGESDMVTLQNIVSTRPIVPPRAYDKEYPKALEAVVMKALAREPGMRFQTAADLETALDRVFPPRVGRVRTEDVGKFVSGLLGERGKERREALKEAIRLADERAAGLETAQVAQLTPLEEIGSHGGSGRPSRASFPGTPVSSASATTGTLQTATTVERPSAPNPAQSYSGLQANVTQPGPFGLPAVPVAAERPSSAPTTPFSASAPASHQRPKSNRGLLFAVGGMAIATILVVGAIVVTRFSSPASPGATRTVAPAPTASRTLAPARPSAAAEPSAPGDADAGGEPVVEATELEVEKAGSSPAAPPSPSRRRTAPGPKPKVGPGEPKKPPKKKPGGFVPPPVSDPGF